MTLIRIIESGQPQKPHDEYAAAFAVGQEAADIAVKSRNPLAVFERIRRHGLKALRTEQPPRQSVFRAWHQS